MKEFKDSYTDIIAAKYGEVIEKLEGLRSDAYREINMLRNQLGHKSCSNMELWGVCFWLRLNVFVDEFLVLKENVNKSK